jgi:hypothetical protein
MMNGSRGETLFRDRYHLRGRISPALTQHGIITTCSRLRSWLGAHYWWLWTFVGVVSVYDAWLVIAFREIIHYTEQNPVGRLLIQLDSNGISYFLTAKAVGTVIVLLALIAVHRIAHRHREWIMGGVASFQAWLLWYLSFAGTFHS